MINLVKNIKDSVVLDDQSKKLLIEQLNILQASFNEKIPDKTHLVNLLLDLHDKQHLMLYHNLGIQSMLLETLDVVYKSLNKSIEKVTLPPSSPIIDDSENTYFIEIPTDFSKFFIWEELVPKDIFESRRDKCIELFTPQSLITLYTIRKELNRGITVNNWKWGGEFQFRGFRPNTYYKTQSLSQHLRGNAFDFDIKMMTAGEGRDTIIQLKKSGKLPYLTGIELDTNWIHIDCRVCSHLNEDGLFLFKP